MRLESAAIQIHKKWTTRMRDAANAFTLAGLIVLVLFSSQSTAQIGPDKLISKVGKWGISTALYGVGCVAQTEYAKPGYEVSISGETSRKLTLLITVDSSTFTAKVDGSQEDIPDIEIALTDNRWGDVKPYGYRGTPGIVLNINAQFLESFASARAIKITEHGPEKLRIELVNPKTVLEKLSECFRRG
jgi:hypothetical protein